MRIFGKGFNYSEDGPGNRLVYHISGCNMRCIWCSNPEGMNTLAGRPISPEEILKEAISCRPMFFDGGGVTFTGGEATLFSDELIDILELLRENGIHTAIETNGTSQRFKEILELTDYLIMDFKHYDSAEHKKYTALGNETVKKNFESACKSGRHIHVRIPLINGINTDNPEAFAEYFAMHRTENTVFEFLPYHEYGKEKWQEQYRVSNGFVDPEVLARFKEVFIENNLKLVET